MSEDYGVSRADRESLSIPPFGGASAPLKNEGTFEAHRVKVEKNSSSSTLPYNDLNSKVSHIESQAVLSRNIDKLDVVPKIIKNNSIRLVSLNQVIEGFKNIDELFHLIEGRLHKTSELGDEELRKIDKEAVVTRLLGEDGKPQYAAHQKHADILSTMDLGRRDEQGNYVPTTILLLSDEVFGEVKKILADTIERFITLRTTTTQKSAKPGSHQHHAVLHGGQSSHIVTAARVHSTSQEILPGSSKNGEKGVIAPSSSMEEAKRRFKEIGQEELEKNEEIYQKELQRKERKEEVAHTTISEEALLRDEGVPTRTPNKQHSPEAA